MDSSSNCSFHLARKLQMKQFFGNLTLAFVLILHIVHDIIVPITSGIYPSSSESS